MSLECEGVSFFRCSISGLIYVNILQLVMFFALHYVRPINSFIYLYIERFVRFIYSENPLPTIELCAEYTFNRWWLAGVF